MCNYLFNRTNEKINQMANKNEKIPQRHKLYSKLLNKLLSLPHI